MFTKNVKNSIFIKNLKCNSVASPSVIMLSLATVPSPFVIMSVSTSAVVLTVATAPVILMVVVVPAVVLTATRAVLVSMALTPPTAVHLGWMMPIVIAVMLP